jgi:pimeloyl-ACP methyl ester carboxylesterase
MARPFSPVIVFAVLVAFCHAQEAGLNRIGYFGASLRAPEQGQKGAEVRRVADGSEAARTGLKVGDRILTANGRPVASDAAIENYFNRFRGGEKVTFETVRDGKTQQIVATLPPMPKEEYAGVEITYDAVRNSRGERLRTLISRPAKARGKMPVVVIVGWLSCDSIEYPFGGGSGLDRVVQYLVGKSGFVTVRMDKPGVGDSEGVCAESDFQSEISGYQAAVASLKKYPFVDIDRVLVVGLSNGGGFSPLALGDMPARGWVSIGSWGRSWYEHMLAIERSRLALSGSTPAQVNDAMKKFTEFYQMYLIQKMTPGQVLAKKPEWKTLWYDGDTTQYGRSAAFYQQLQDLNLGDVWARTSGPVLVIRGEFDWIMPREDGHAIVDTVNQVRPGTARYVEAPRASHGLMQFESLKASFDGGQGTYYQEIENVIQKFLNDALAQSASKGGDR